MTRAEWTICRAEAVGSNLPPSGAECRANRASPRPRAVPQDCLLRCVFFGANVGGCRRNNLSSVSPVRFACPQFATEDRQSLSHQRSSAGLLACPQCPQSKTVNSALHGVRGCEISKVISGRVPCELHMPRFFARCCPCPGFLALRARRTSGFG